MKKLLALVLTLACVMSLVACGGSKTEAPAANSGDSSSSAPAAPVKATVLKLNHPSAEGGPYDLMSKEFKRLIEEKTEGRYQIEIYNSNALGTQEEALESCALGTLDMCVNSDDKMATYAEEWGYLGLPFVFEDVDDVDENMNGELGEYLSGLLADKGLMVLSFFENGFRTTTSNTRIETPADLKGVKIRTITTPAVQDMYTAAGAVVTNVSFSELYTALQLGTCDAQENPYANIVDKKFYEVQKYMTLDLHSHTCEPLIMSMATWNKLSAEDQAIFKECGLEASKWAYQYSKDTSDANLEFLRGQFTEVVEPDMQVWRDFAAQTNAKYADQYANVAAMKH